MSSSKMSRLKRKNAAGSRIDKGWEHGIDVEDNSKKVKCKYCQKIFSGGIYRFKHHLACTHENVEACLSVPDDVKKEFWVLVSQIADRKKQKIVLEYSGFDSNEIEQEVVDRRKGKGVMDSLSQKLSSRGSVKTGDKQITLNQMFKKDLREEACQQIARFFYISAIPFNCVKSPEFAKMFELAIKHGPGFKPPSYHEMREKYLNKEVANTTCLLEEYKLEWKKTGCSVMSDGWTDKKRRSIVNFLVNSPKGTVFVSSLDTSDISKTADVVFKMLDDIIEKVGEENVVQVVTDNAANYKAAGEMLMEKRKKLYWTPCAAHCIDLMLEDFEKKLQVHSETITNGKKITNFIYGRGKLISTLRDLTKGRDLVRAAATRFATSYLTLGSLNDHRGALMSMFMSNEWKKSRYAATVEGKKVNQIVLDSEFWKNVSMCLRAAYSLIKVLRLVDSDEKPAMGFIFDAMDKAKQKIRENFNNVKRSYEPIWRIIDARWEFQLHRPLHAAGYYLNPQFHYRQDFKTGAQLKIGLYNCLEKMVPDAAERDKIEVQIDHFRDSKGLFGIETAIRSRENKPPAKWWESFGDECPELQQFAIRVLSLTCSSSGCERNWSAFEMVHTKRRNRLHQKKMNDLVFVMYNSKLKERRRRTDDNVDTNFENLDSDNEWIAEDCEVNDLVVEDQLKLLDVAQKEEAEEDISITNPEKNSIQQREGDDLEIDDAFDIEDDDIGLNALGENIRGGTSNDGSAPSELVSKEIDHGDNDVGNIGDADAADVFF